ncbi:MAG TPA: aminopeptidase P family N-terminal domain-containing protein, partial [Bacteroidota bacterium]|nr:aminopeptidase P family N-terminal domain-containing protein [Bacteroidota bacterium]
MTTRLNNLRAQFRALNIDAFLVTHPPHVRYLSNFSGSNGIGLVTKRGAIFLTDSRYREQIKSEVKGWKTIVASGGLFAELRRQKLIGSGMRVGIDGNAMVLNQFQELKRNHPSARFLPKVEVIDRLAAVKDADEIRKIAKAVSITDRVFT